MDRGFLKVKELKYLDFLYFTRIYKNVINLSILYKFNLNNFYLLPKLKSLFVSIVLHNLFHISDLRVFKAYYLIFYLIGCKPYVSKLSNRYAGSKKLFNINIVFFTSSNFSYNLLLKFSRNFFFKLREFFFYENTFKLFYDSFFFTISNINL